MKGCKVSPLKKQILFKISQKNRSQNALSRRRNIGYNETCTNGVN